MRTKVLLTQNSELKAIGVWAWTLPAHHVDLDGSKFTICPQAGACAAFCYARVGRWAWSHVKKAHVWKLRYVLERREEWKAHLIAELERPRFRPGPDGSKFVRVHDGGDFFDEGYARDWFVVMRSAPDVRFYAYTKQVELMKRLAPEFPENFTVVYSLGGLQDNLVDRDVDRHSDVFPSIELLLAAGYSDIAEDDRLAATSPNNRVGIVANKIPFLRKRQRDKTFSEWQRGEGKSV